MTQKDALYAATFSLMMPGLGQLFTHRIVPGVGFFMIFATLLALPNTRLLLPLLVIVAASEAYFSLKAKTREGESWRTGEVSYWRSQKDQYRLPLFTFVGILGAIAWIFLFFPQVTPLGAQSDLNDRVDRIAENVYRYRTRHGVPPHSLEAALREGGLSHLLLDPWGFPYVLEVSETGFFILSAGPDSKMGTADDSRYTFPYGRD
ncbi:MAG: hypothetical protein KDD51_10820 [Bdellovibrionales bacterium]|nr:hypothetical protein [Bdellovibrionales bacterium]